MVSVLEEGLALRGLVPQAQIWLLNGLAAGEEQACIDAELVPVINQLEQLERWQGFPGTEGLSLVLQFDTGIRRLGLHLETLERVRALAPKPLAIMSHLACADIPEHPLNQQQLHDFTELAATFPAALRSLANSGGVYLGADWHFDLCRCGIALYAGVVDSALQQVARISAPVMQIAAVATGDSVGYNARWQAPGLTRIATVPLGYADGWPLHSEQPAARIRGHLVPVVGQISMDMMTLDVSAHPDIAVGDTAEWLGPALPLTEVAHRNGCSPYQLLTGLGGRLERHYQKST